MSKHKLPSELSDLIDQGVNLLGTNTPAAVSDPAACAAMTFAAGSIDTGTDMTAAEAAAIVTDLAALKTAIDANNTAIDAIIDALQAAYLMQ